MSMTLSKKTSTACIAGLLSVCFSTISHANPIREQAPVEQAGLFVGLDTGAAERIDVADRLRTLTQEIPAAACHLHGNINPDESRALLKEAHEEFLSITAALLNGSEKYQIIGAETRPKTLIQITEVISSWVPTDRAVLTLLDAPHDAKALATIKANNQPLFDQTSTLLGQLIAEYANPVELLLADAVLIDIAGRLSMLTQKLSKEVCTVWTGNRSEAAVAALGKTIQMFDLSVKALHDGEASLGIKPAPTDEIKRSLEAVVSDWDGLLAKIAVVKAQDVVADEVKAEIYHTLNEKMYKLDHVVHLYTEFANRTMK